MSKRFTDTEKWRDPWFCGLGLTDRLFWIFILDNCTLAGIWQVNWPLVTFYIPEFTFRDELFKDRIQKISDTKWFIPKFIRFQYGELSRANRLHQRVLFDLQKEGVSKGLIGPLEGDKDKDKDKDMDKDKDKEGESEGKQTPFKKTSSLPTAADLRRQGVV